MHIKARIHGDITQTAFACAGHVFLAGLEIDAGSGRAAFTGLPVGIFRVGTRPEVTVVRIDLPPGEAGTLIYFVSSLSKRWRRAGRQAAEYKTPALHLINSCPESGSRRCP